MLNIKDTEKDGSVWLARVVVILLWLFIIILIIGAVVFIIYFWAVVLAFGVCCVVGFGLVYFIVLLLSG